MLYFLIVAVIVAILAVSFALQNADPVLVQFLFFQVESSLALILLITLAIGIFLGASAMTYRILKLHRRITAGKKEIEDLEDRLHKALERKTERVPPPPKSSGDTAGTSDKPKQDG